MQEKAWDAVFSEVIHVFLTTNQHPHGTVWNDTQHVVFVLFGSGVHEISVASLLMCVQSCVRVTFYECEALWLPTCGEHMRSISHGTVALFRVHRLPQTRWINEVAKLRAKLTTQRQQLQLMQQRMEQLAEAAREMGLRGRTADERGSAISMVEVPEQRVAQTVQPRSRKVHVREVTRETLRAKSSRSSWTTSRRSCACWLRVLW